MPSIHQEFFCFWFDSAALKGKRRGNEVTHNNTGDLALW